MFIMFFFCITMLLKHSSICVTRNHKLKLMILWKSVKICYGALWYIWKHVSWESRFRCCAGYKMLQRYILKCIPIKLVKEDEIVRPYDRHSTETETLRKHVSKYKHMRKWMMEFLRKFENRGIKMARFNSIFISKSIYLQLFAIILYGVGGPFDFVVTLRSLN